MKRISTLVAAVLAAAAIATTTGSATADASPSCSNFKLPEPTLGGGIHLEAAAQCTSTWQIGWTLQAEVQGVWTDQSHGWRPTSGNGVTCPSFVGEVSSRCFSAGSFHDETWTATANVSPYCAFRWRNQVQFQAISAAGDTSVYFATSPIHAKECP